MNALYVGGQLVNLSVAFCRRLLQVVGVSFKGRIIPVRNSSGWMEGALHKYVFDNRVGIDPHTTAVVSPDGPFSSKGSGMLV